MRIVTRNIRLRLLTASSCLLLCSDFANAGNLDGKELFDSKNCSVCHTIGGHGGQVGPALDGEGKKRTPDWLSKQLTNPASTRESDSQYGAMPNPKLTKDEITALVSYLSSLK